MSSITNNYAEGSCVFEAGSSQNGDVHITGGTFNQGVAKSENEANLSPSVAAGHDACGVGSPVFLSKKKGTKIDFIRVMNAWYECGKVDDGNGGKLTKKEFFTWVGKAFNIDLADYDKDLSNSMASGVAYDKQTRIFDELKEKQQEIFNSK